MGYGVKCYFSHCTSLHLGKTLKRLKYLLSFLLFATLCYYGLSKPSPYQNFNGNSAPPQIDTLHLDTTAVVNIAALIHIPDALQLLSCQISIASKGEILKMEYSDKGHDDRPDIILSFLNRLHHGDGLSFENIYVLKQGKRFRYPDKHFINP